LDPKLAGVDKPVIGLAFSFPGSYTAKKIKYKVNNIYWKQEFGNDES
jgi:hypothetical protein